MPHTIASYPLGWSHIPSVLMLGLTQKASSLAVAEDVSGHQQQQSFPLLLLYFFLKTMCMQHCWVDRRLLASELCGVTVSRVRDASYYNPHVGLAVTVVEDKKLKLF